MATFTNQSANSTTYTNSARQGKLTWNAATPTTWDDALQTWDETSTALTNVSLNSTSFTNQAKN